jgi:hypothetical protein
MAARDKALDGEGFFLHYDGSVRGAELEVPALLSADQLRGGQGSLGLPEFCCQEDLARANVKNCGNA